MTVIGGRLNDSKPVKYMSSVSNQPKDPILKEPYSAAHAAARFPLHSITLRFFARYGTLSFVVTYNDYKATMTANLTW